MTNSEMIKKQIAEFKKLLTLSNSIDECTMKILGFLLKVTEHNYDNISDLEHKVGCIAHRNSTCESELKKLKDVKNNDKK